MSILEIIGLITLLPFLITIGLIGGAFILGLVTALSNLILHVFVKVFTSRMTYLLIILGLLIYINVVLNGI